MRFHIEKRKFDVVVSTAVKLRFGGWRAGTALGMRENVSFWDKSLKCFSCIYLFQHSTMASSRFGPLEFSNAVEIDGEK